MITFVEGLLEEKAPARVVLNVGGVGYELFLPLSSFDRLPDVGKTCRLLTVDHVREDAHVLFGFARAAERTMFERLMSISGIGPKLALSALSSLSVRELTAAIVDGNVAMLTRISGVGRKVAERMVVELRDKIDAGEALEATAGEELSGDVRLHDAMLALVSLGYKQADARKMVQKVHTKITDSFSVEDIIRLALTGQ